MSRLKIEQGDWVVVCDGSKALIFENIGDAKYLNLKTREVYEHENARTREQGSDAPGRTIQSVGEKRSAMEQTDWHDQAEKEFISSLAQRLDRAVTGGETKSLIVVAAPRALGILRQTYSPQLRASVRTEVGKDYVKMPVHEIERHLMED